MTGNPEPIDWDGLIQRDRVHGSLYTDEAIFQQELEKIWYSTWVYVGHISEVPNKNDFIKKSIGPQEVIMVRDRHDAVQLLLNRCAHRGNQVCMEHAGNRKTFTCPYHGWTFGNDGGLLGMPFPDGYKELDRSQTGLGKVARVADYKGFVFGSFADEGPTLEEHLGKGGRDALDRLVQTSPEGEVDITTGFLRHKCKANWKFLLENETDGYHPQFVHASIFNISDSAIGELYAEGTTAVARDFGHGHTENDLRPEFRKRGELLSWFGTTPDKLPGYVEKMRAAYGKEQGDEIMIDGAPHVMIFPNLFIAEIQMFVLQPLAVDETVQHVTALQFKGAPDLNKRMLRQTMGSVGPAGFLLADDNEMYERNQRGVAERRPAWNYLGRGLHREERDDNGYLIGDNTDEVTSRGIWRHYRELMEAAA